MVEWLFLYSDCPGTSKQPEHFCPTQSAEGQFRPTKRRVRKFQFVGPQCQLQQLQSWDSTLGPNFKLLLFKHRIHWEFSHSYTLQLCRCEAQTEDLLRLNGWYPFECYSTAVKMFPNCKLLPIYSFTEPRLGFSQVAYILNLRWSMGIQFDAPGHGTAHNN